MLDCIPLSDDVSWVFQISNSIISDLPEFENTWGKISQAQIPFCCQISYILPMYTITHYTSIVNHALQNAPSVSN